MKILNSKYARIWLGTTMLGLGISAPSFGDVPTKVANASQVIVDRLTSAQPIPKWVSDSGICLASLKTLKVGFIWGGAVCTGMSTCRTAEEDWSEPSFFTVSNVNFGLQIGIQFMESVMVFLTPNAKELLSGSFQIGVDASFAAGPVGEGSGTGVLPMVDILSYEYSQGLYVGATIDGFIIAPDNRSNRTAYGTSVAPSDLLSTSGTHAPASVRPFLNTIEKRFSRVKRDLSCRYHKSVSA